MEINQIEAPKKEIVLLGNGSRVEVSSWSKDKKSLYGRVLDVTPTISIYIPVSYLASNIVKPQKKK